WRPSYRSDGRGRRADAPGQTQRRRGREKAVTAVRAQPARELGQVPELAEMDAVLEDAMLVQRHRRMRPRLGDAGGNQLDREVVGDQAGGAAIAHPLQHALVASLEAAAGAVQELRVGVLAQLEDPVGEAGVEAEQVAALDP